jgi:hypothetical protein
MPPLDYVEGDIEGMPFYAGQSCGLVRDVIPAAAIVRRIVAETCAAIEQRLVPLLR